MKKPTLAMKTLLSISRIRGNISVNTIATSFENSPKPFNTRLFVPLNSCSDYVIRIVISLRFNMCRTMLLVLPLVEFSKVFTIMIVAFLSLPRIEKECYKMRRYNIISSMLGEPIITSSFSG